MNSYDSEESGHFYGPMISIGREEVVLHSENCKSTAKGKKSHGFHLVRSKWDPYPWIGSVECLSSASASGLRSGDCLLEVDGRDILGLEMKDIAFLIGRNEQVSLGIWRRPPKSNYRAGNADFACLEEKENKEFIKSRAEHTGTLLEGPLPEVAQKLVRAVSGVVKALECPVCLDSAAPPVSQCVHGHLLCFGCRLKTARCPVCRVRLGQGRCLLADKSHRILTEALVDTEPSNATDDPVNAGNRSLHDSIFGSSNHAKKRKNPASVRKAKDLMSKILSSSRADDRNVSTESLPTTSCVMDGNLLYGRRWLLRLYDRRKSASTGELNRGGSSVDENPTNGSFTELRDGEESVKYGSLLSVPRTPVWGGSTESMTIGRLCCPLKERTGCQEFINSTTLMDHLSAQHSGPMIHFYKNRIIMPFPFPFQEDAVYILHHKDENFILLNQQNNIWISNSESNCGINWDWILHAVANDETEVHLRKEVCSLKEPLELLPRHIAILPAKFSGSNITISLIELHADEGCVKV